MLTRLAAPTGTVSSGHTVCPRVPGGPSISKSGSGAAGPFSVLRLDRWESWYLALSGYLLFCAESLIQHVFAAQLPRVRTCGEGRSAHERRGDGGSGRRGQPGRGDGGWGGASPGVGAHDPPSTGIPRHRVELKSLEFKEMEGIGTAT